jgi:hypothetical protein
MYDRGELLDKQQRCKKKQMTAEHRRKNKKKEKEKNQGNGGFALAS